MDHALIAFQHTDSIYSTTCARFLTYAVQYGTRIMIASWQQYPIQYANRHMSEYDQQMLTES